MPWYTQDDDVDVIDIVIADVGTNLATIDNAAVTLSADDLLQVDALTAAGQPPLEAGDIVGGGGGRY